MKKLLFFSFLLFLSQISADQFPKEIVIIGDSLSDSGNSRPALAIISGNFLLRDSPVSNGTTWPVILADKMDAADLLPSTREGTNFAYVGSLTKGAFAHFPNPSLTQQVRMLPGSLDRNAPVFILGGANDIFFDPATIKAGDVAALDLLTIFQTLHDKGFKTLVSFTLPNLSLLPSAGINTVQYEKESLELNRVLTAGLKDLSFPVFQVDLFTAFNQIVANPEKFGLTDSTNAPDFTTENTTGFVFFYDGTHPTQQSHDIIADYVFSLISAPEYLNLMSQKPATFVRQHATNLKNQLYPIQCEQECQTLYFFVSGNYSPVENSAFDRCFDRRDQQGGDFTFGFTDRVSECVTLGLAGGYGFDFTKLKEENTRFEFDLQAWTISALASFHADHGYLNGLFTTSFLDFDEIERLFSMGAAKFKTKADTNGIDYSGELYGAYHFISCDCRLKTGPLFDVNYQYISIDGYKEKKSLLGNLQFKDFSRQFLTTGLGWEVRLENGWPCFDLISDFFLLGNYQWFKDKEKIKFRERNISGHYGAWPIENPRYGFLSGGAHFTGCFSNGMRTTLSYDFNIGDKNLSEHFITLSLTFPIWRMNCCE